MSDAGPAAVVLPEAVPASRNPLHVVEDTFSIVAFSLMTILPVFAIVVRRLGLPDLPGNSEIVQHLTLWIGMLGGALAARSDRLLGLSLMELLPVKLRPPIKVFTNLVLAAVCSALTVSSIVFVRSLVGDFLPHVSKQAVSSIMPIGFGLIAIRAVWHAGKGWLPKAIAAVGLLPFVPYILGLLFHFPVPEIPVETAGLFTAAMALLIGAAVLGLPIFAVFGGLALLLFWGDGTPAASVPEKVRDLVVNPLLPSIPLFTLAGYFMVQGGATRRLLRVFTALFSWIPGGLALATVAICTVFTFAGSGLTILSLGALLVPMLVKTRYPENFSIGLLTSSGSLGLLFPTSVPAILYCVRARIPMNKLFTGAILPELVMVLAIAAVGVYKGIKHNAVRQPFSPREAGAAIWNAKWELLLPVIMITGIFGGFGTLTEAAAVTAFAAFIVETFIYKGLSLRRDFRMVFVECATIVGGILIIMGVALAFTDYLVYQDVPTNLVDWVKAHVSSKFVFLLLINGVLLVVGALMDIFAAILVVVPLLTPLAAAYGVDPVQMGIIFIANLELGYLHPPVGINLFLAAYRFKKPMGTVIWATLPFLLILMGTVLLITYVPWLTTAPLKWFGLAP